jgi:hypothetical protein
MYRIVTVGLTSLPPSLSRLSRQCGLLNVSQLYRPLTGRAFTSFLRLIRVHTQVICLQEPTSRVGRQIVLHYFGGEISKIFFSDLGTFAYPFNYFIYYYYYFFFIFKFCWGKLSLSTEPRLRNRLRSNRTELGYPSNLGGGVHVFDKCRSTRVPQDVKLTS